MFFWRRRHPVTEEELSAYLDGELEDAARARFEAHIEDCAACREVLEELRAVRRALRDLPRTDAPRSFALREADLRPAPAPWAMGAFARATPLLSGVATAAVVVFGVLVGIDLTGPTSQGAADKDAAAAALQGVSDEAEMGAAVPDNREQVPSGDAGVEAADATSEAPTTEGLDGGSAPSPEPSAACDGTEPCEDGSNERSSGFGGITPAPAPGGTMTGAEEAEGELPAQPEAEAGGPDRIRVAEGGAAVVALLAGGSLALVWWRRRT